MQLVINFVKRAHANDEMFSPFENSSMRCVHSTKFNACTMHQKNAQVVTVDSKLRASNGIQLLHTLDAI